MNIGKIIKKIRQERGLKQIDLVKLTKLSKSYISEIEKGTKTPRLEQLEIISQALKVPLSVMFFIAIEKEDVDLENKESILGELQPHIDKISELFKLSLAEEENNSELELAYEAQPDSLIN